MASIGMPIDIQSTNHRAEAKQHYGGVDDLDNLHEDLVNGISIFLMEQARDNPNKLNQQILTLRDSQLKMLARDLAKNTVIKAYESQEILNNQSRLASVQDIRNINDDLPYQEMGVGCQSGSFTHSNANNSRYPVDTSDQPAKGFKASRADQIIPGHLLNNQNRNS